MPARDDEERPEAAPSALSLHGGAGVSKRQFGAPHTPPSERFRRSRRRERPRRPTRSSSFRSVSAAGSPRTSASTRIACKEPASTRGPHVLEFRAQGDGQAPRRQARPGIKRGPEPRGRSPSRRSMREARPSGRVLVGDHGRFVNRSPSTPWAFFDRASDAWQRWTRRARYSRRTLGTGVATPSDRKATLTSRATGV